MARDREFLSVDLLSDGEREIIPIAVAMLLVWRYGIMNLSLYAIILKILLKALAMLTKHREDMPNAVTIVALRHADQRICYLTNI